MSDDLLKALGRAAREDNAEVEAEAKAAPPLDEATRDAWAEAALSELGPAKTSAPSKVARRRILPFVGSGLALAAAIALYVTTQKSDLPEYAFSVQGSTREWRGDETTKKNAIEVRADGTIEILARPAHAVTSTIDARAFATHDATRKTLPVDVSSQGVVRVSGNVRELFAVPKQGPEEWRVVLTIGERKTELVVVVTPN